MVETTATYPNGQGGRQVNNLPQPDTWHTLYTLQPPNLGNQLVFASSVPDDVRRMFTELTGIWAAHLGRNMLRYRYYDGKNKLKDFGISTPPELLSVETVVGWPNKAVTALADRVRFDGFTAADDDVQKRLDDLTKRAGFMRRMRFLPHSEEIYGFYMGVVGVDGDGNAQIDFYDAEHSAGVWDAAKGRIAYGLTIEEIARDGEVLECRVFTDDEVINLWYDGKMWRCDITPIKMGRIPMDAFTYRPTDCKPFGQSRVSRAVMSITDSAVRAALGADISYQFAVSPQKFLLGAAEDPFRRRNGKPTSAQSSQSGTTASRASYRSSGN